MKTAQLKSKDILLMSNAQRKQMHACLLEEETVLRHNLDILSSHIEDEPQEYDVTVHCCLVIKVPVTVMASDEDDAMEEAWEVVNKSTTPDIVEYLKACIESPGIYIYHFDIDSTEID